MTITVFHLKRDLDRNLRLDVTSPLVDGLDPKQPGYFDAMTAARAKSAKELLANGGYEEAATVATGDLDLAFQLTNNIQNSWSREPDPRVKPAGLGYIEHGGKQYGYKSSEVGDVFKIEETGEYYVVDSFGFAPFPNE